MLQILWAFFLVTFPFGLRFLVFEDWSYRFGNFNPWVSGFVYAPEAVLWVVFLGWVIQTPRTPLLPPPLKLRRAGRGARQISLALFIKREFLFFLFLLNILAVSWANGTLVLGAFLVLRLVEAGMFYVLLRSSLLPLRQMVFFLMSGAAIQFVIGTLQVFLGHSLGLAWFGEPVIATNMVGVAKRDLAAGAKQLRAYGTFLHANIFAAYILIVYWMGRGIFWIPPTPSPSPRLRYSPFERGRLFFLVTVLGLYFAFSRAAFAMFPGGLILVFLFQTRWMKAKMAIFAFILFGLLIALNVGMVFWQGAIHNQSLSERVEQIQISRSMILDHPFGVGVGGYTLHMQDYASRKLAPWEFQPVHNVYFIILNELGLQGLILLLVFFGYYMYRLFFCVSSGQDMSCPYYKFVLFFSVLVLASVDHFFWDSWAGLMLATLVFASAQILKSSNA